jgi:hypothetical protein
MSFKMGHKRLNIDYSDEIHERTGEVLNPIIEAIAASL